MRYPKHYCGIHETPCFSLVNYGHFRFNTPIYLRIKYIYILGNDTSIDKYHDQPYLIISEIKKPELESNWSMITRNGPAQQEQDKSFRDFHLDPGRINESKHEPNWLYCDL